MPKGFRNTNLNQRMPGRRIPPGPPLPPRATQAGFRPSKEKSRPPGWAPPTPPDPVTPAEPGKESSAKPEPKKP
jgi:hypothetical protein